MSDDDDIPGGAAGGAPEAVKGWSEQDRRTLAIGFVGGLAANVGTVVLVGAAIALARAAAAKGPGSGLLLWWLAVIAAGLTLVAVGNATRRGRRFGPVRPIPAERMRGRPPAWLLVAMGWLAVLEGCWSLWAWRPGVK